MVCGLQAADRVEITFADARIFPESLTSTKDGDIYFGSLGHDSVYRATSKSSNAEVWIEPKSNGLSTVLGVFADEKAGTLWVCSSATGGRNGQPYVGETALKAYVLNRRGLRIGIGSSGPTAGRIRSGGMCPALTTTLAAFLRRLPPSSAERLRAVTFTWASNPARCKSFPR